MRKFRTKMALLMSAILSVTPVVQASASHTVLARDEVHVNAEAALNTEAKGEEISNEETKSEETSNEEIKNEETKNEETDEETASQEALNKETENAKSDEDTLNENSESEEATDKEVADKEAVDKEASIEEITSEDDSDNETENEDVKNDASNEDFENQGEFDVEKYLNYMDVDDEEAGTPDKSAFNDEADCLTVGELPVKYDGRAQNRVSSVKNQNPFGSCWAFTAVALAESAYMDLYDKGADEVNLSESHLVEFFYNNDDDELHTNESYIGGDIITPIGNTQEERGGNTLYTTPVLASWKGIADEALDDSLKYETAVANNEAEIDSKYAFTDAVHLENAYFIPITDTEGVKNAIMEYGGVATAYYYSSTYDSPYTGGEAYYCPVDIGGTNHAVTIVGWDDEYSIENFKTTSYYKPGKTTLPENDGAWLIKNSWGEGYHDGGYFWMSYEDANIASTAYAYDFGKADNYDYNYQYDGGAASSLYSNIKKSAAIYEATGNQEIEAIGVMLRSTDVEYTAKVYTEISDMSNPTSGTLIHSQTGKTTYEGFYTIELTKSVKIPKGEKFSVVLEYKDYTRVAADVSNNGSSWINMSIDYEDEHTFYSTGTSWKSFSAETTTMRMKAYTSKSMSLFENMLGEIEPQIYTGSQITPSVTVTTSEGVVLTEGVDYTLDYSDNVEIGQATITITGKGDYSGSVSTTFEIAVAELTEEMLNAPDRTYNGEIYKDAKIVIEGNDIPKECYTLTYYKESVCDENKLTYAPTDAGSYVVVAEGIINCKGIVQKVFCIDKLNVDIVMEALDCDYSGEVYNGMTYSFEADGNKVDVNDYQIRYFKDETQRGEALQTIPTEAGKYVVTIVCGSNYQGAAEKSFEIRQLPISLNVNDTIYTGLPFECFEVTAGGDKLTDFEVLFYCDGQKLESAPVDAGKYTITVKGSNNYCGEPQSHFEIFPISLEPAKITALYEDMSFTGMEISVDDKVLAESDYTIEYTDMDGNILDQMPIQPGKYYAKVTGKGNYKDTITTEFEIAYKKLSAEMFEVNDAIYNGQPYDAVVFRMGTLNKSDFEIVYNKEPVNTGKYTVSVTGKNDLEGTLVYEFEIQKLTLAPDMVTITEQCEYTGTAIMPEIELKADGHVIPETDYSVKYANNKNAGTATVTIQGKKNCQGTVIKNFEILPKSVDTASVEVEKAVYTGSPLMPKIIVKNGKTKLKAGNDYTISYGENITDADTVLTDSVNPVITITGCGNYTGKKDVSFVIEPMNVNSKQVNVYLNHNEKGETSLNVYLNDIRLSEGKDYQAEIFNQTTNQKVSDISRLNVEDEYAVTLEFKGNYVSKESINIKNIECKMDINDHELRFVENGEYVLRLSPVIYNKKAQKPKIVLVSGENVLDKSNYKVIYKNNINAGIATITVIGKGKYSGGMSANFEIHPKELGKDIKISGLNDKIYTGKEIKPSVSIKGLKKGKDFRVTAYENNINACHNSEIRPKLTIELSDNYTIAGKNTITKEFNIKPARITSVKVAKGYYQNGEAVQPALTVKAGKLVLSENDYTVKWENNKEIGKASATVSVNSQNGNFYILKPIKVSFRISKESLSKARLVQIKTPVYTGTTIDFDKCYKLYDQSGNLINNDEYEVTPDKQIAAGNVTVTFKAKTDSRFTGRKTVKCKVEAAYIGDYLELTQTGLPMKYYNNGKAITFTKKELKAAFKDKVTGEAILPDSFTVKYENNTEAGEAKLYITGKKNYGGTMVINFDIRSQ